VSGKSVSLNRKQARAMFSRITRKKFGVNGDTWVVNYVNGKYREMERNDDDKFMFVRMLIPFWTPKGWRKA
jgi:hypothetical protein